MRPVYMYLMHAVYEAKVCGSADAGLRLKQILDFDIYERLQAQKHEIRSTGHGMGHRVPVP